MQELRSELLSSSSPSPSSASHGCGGWQLVPFGNLCPLQGGSLRRRGEGPEVSGSQGVSKIAPHYMCRNTPPRAACARAEGFAGQTNPLPCILLLWGRCQRSPQQKTSVAPRPPGPLAGRRLAHQSSRKQCPSARPQADSRTGSGTHWGQQVAQVRNAGTACSCQTSPRAGRPGSHRHRLPSSETGRPGHGPQRHSSSSSSGPGWPSAGSANQRRGTSARDSACSLPGHRQPREGQGSRRAEQVHRLHLLEDLCSVPQLPDGSH